MKKIATGLLIAIFMAGAFLTTSLTTQAKSDPVLKLLKKVYSLAKTINNKLSTLSANDSSLSSSISGIDTKANDLVTKINTIDGNVTSVKTTAESADYYAYRAYVYAFGSTYNAGLSCINTAPTLEALDYCKSISDISNDFGLSSTASIQSFKNVDKLNSEFQQAKEHRKAELTK